VIDPKFDGAYSGLARTLAVIWGYEVPVAGGTDAQRGAAAARRALALNPRNAEAQSALGLILVQQLWDWDEGMRAIRAAIELAPNDAEVANFAGDVFRAIGDLEHGDLWERRAVELDPLLTVNYVDLGFGLLQQRRCREAIEPLTQARRMDPDGVLGLDPLARAHLCLRDFAAAKQAIELIASRTPEFASDLPARLAIKTGQREQAQVQIKLFQARADKGELLNYQLGQLYALSGDNTAAATALTRAIAQHDPLVAGDELYALPEDWPDDPAIRAALDAPSIKPLFDMRRGFIQSQKLRVGHD
jgi:Tfp pilus assembly protein PilF